MRARLLVITYMICEGEKNVLGLVSQQQIDYVGAETTTKVRHRTADLLRV